MAETLQRIRNKDDLIYFASYFDTNKPRMKEIVAQLEVICEEVKKRKDDVPRKTTLAAAGGGAAGAVVGVGAGVATAFVLAPLTAGLSLVVAAGTAAVVITGSAAAVTAAGAVVVYDKITDKETLEKVKDLVTEFCDLVQPLKDVHTEKREMFEKLDRKVAEILDLLATLIKGLFLLFIKLRANSTEVHLRQITAQCRHILKDLEELRTNMRPGSVCRT